MRTLFIEHDDTLIKSFQKTFGRITYSFEEPGDITQWGYALSRGNVIVNAQTMEGVQHLYGSLDSIKNTIQPTSWDLLMLNFEIPQHKGWTVADPYGFRCLLELTSVANIKYAIVYLLVCNGYRRRASHHWPSVNIDRDLLPNRYLNTYWYDEKDHQQRHYEPEQVLDWVKSAYEINGTKVLFVYDGWVTYWSDKEQREPWPKMWREYLPPELQETL